LGCGVAQWVFIALCCGICVMLACTGEFVGSAKVPGACADLNVEGVVAALSVVSML